MELAGAVVPVVEVMGFAVAQAETNMVEDKNIAINTLPTFDRCLIKMERDVIG